MKAAEEHRVPLSAEARAVLDGARGLDHDIVFPGAQPGSVMSDMTLAAVLRRLGIEATVHGFRSTFRDWAGECSNLPREVAELALAHKVGNAVERAYARSDLFEKRQQLMAQWGRWCCRRPGNVVELPRSTVV